MDSVRATAVFGAAYVLRGIVDAMGTGGRHAALVLAIVTTISTIAFWLGARRRNYRWYVAATAGFVSCFLFLALVKVVLGLPRSVVWAVLITAPAVISFGCARILASPPSLNRFRDVA